MQFSIIEMWAVMGPLAKSVVGLLLAMSLVSIATGVEKWFVLRRATRESERFVTQWRERLRQSGVGAAADGADRYPHSHLAHVVIAGTSIVSADLPPDVQGEAYDRTVRRSILATGATMRRGLSVLATVGSTAPFVGLVGTVAGIIRAFQQLATSGQGGVGQVSAGISEALVTTALGIGVAIPAVWFFNHFTQWTARLLVEMECVAEELAVVALGERVRPTTSQNVRASR